MKGHIILTERRSGASWLGSLTNATRKMGSANEHLKTSLELRVHPEQHFQTVLRKSTGPNGHFGLRVAPAPVRITFRRYGYDFIQECRKRHDVKLIVLERRDRLRQAISSVRAKMSGAWTGGQEKTGVEKYDFAAIANEVFLLDQSFAFWRSYLAANAIDHQWMFYEDLMGDPMPYIKALADHHEVAMPPELHSSRQIQRDRLTEDWLERFRSDARERVVFADLDRAMTPKRSVGNLVRFLAKRGVV